MGMLIEVIPEAASSGRIPDCDELVSRAQSLLPKLRERAQAAEEARRLPDETIEDFYSLGIHKIMQPVRFGGYGHGFDVAAEVVPVIASGCGSSGWLANFFTMHNWLASLFPLEAQEEYWAESPNQYFASGSFAPSGSKLEFVEGGARLSGRWKFASGADFANWFVVIKPSADCFDWLMIPRKEVTIIDDWFASGMCASGSRDFVVDDVFVPSHRILKFSDLVTGETPGGKIHGDPYARVSYVLPNVWGIPSVMVGMLDGMAQAFESSMASKKSLFSGERQFERVAIQIKVAEVATDLHAARLIMRHRLQKVKEMGLADEPPSDVEALESHRDAAYTSRLLVNAATKLQVVSGANSIFRSNSIQRFTRDMLAASTHVSLVWEEIAENYGRAKFKLPNKSVLV
jgi:3-hydroxy-9,10-secoandrosta-1,3,5(10)-triene-9,17-dione monooxygenase